jgi:hypothetical protein
MRGARTRVLSDPDAFLPQELSTVAHSMALSGLLDRALARAVFDSIARRCGPWDSSGNEGIRPSPGRGEPAENQLSSESRCALFQCLLVLDSDSGNEGLLDTAAPIYSSPRRGQEPSPPSNIVGGGSEFAGANFDFPSGFYAALEKEWRASSALTIQSNTQKAVLGALARLGIQFRPEAATADGLFVVDAMVELEGAVVAVEVDGPSHYSSNPPFLALGPTLLRRRILAPRVCAAVSVPFYEWDELCGRPEAEEEYIARKVHDAVKLPRTDPR